MSMERRAHPRQMQRYTVRLHIDEPSGESKVIRGILLDLSLGGANVGSDEYVATGQQCLVELVGAGGRVVPNKAPGSVISSGPGPGRQIALRISFDEPLKQIKEPGKL